jgi:catechol 2,3-dioxygenase-like lactoylglutathione lyase family enzyme
VPRFEAIGVTVSDLRRSAAFYSLLGLEFADLDADHGHVEAALPGGLRFMLDSEETIRSFNPDWTPPTGGHRTGLAFVCDSPTDVDAQYEELLQAGGTPQLPPWDAFWGQRYATVLDPDGNVVDLFAPLGD